MLTLSVQYYVNLRSVRSNTQFIVEQQQAIMAGVTLGVKSLSSGLYLDQMREQAKQPLLGEQAELTCFVEPHSSSMRTRSSSVSGSSA